MAFAIRISEDAKRQLGLLRARDRSAILDQVEKQLAHAPTVPTRRRKLLEPNPLADWELRLGKYRVFYTADPEKEVVLVLVVGEKRRNVLVVEGKEYRL
jgi:mRNA-degrading endonuclease RelE of RelBE toxin-antitoxin system